MWSPSFWRRFSGLAALAKLSSSVLPSPVRLRFKLLSSIEGATRQRSLEPSRKASQSANRAGFIIRRSRFSPRAAISINFIPALSSYIHGNERVLVSESASSTFNFIAFSRSAVAVAPASENEHFPRINGDFRTSVDFTDDGINSFALHITDRK